MEGLAKLQPSGLQYTSARDLMIPAMEELLKPPSGVMLDLWPTFSDMIGGMRAHELTLLCAGTGVGKTALLANISAQLMKQNVAHFVAPVETGDIDFITRVSSVLAGVDVNHGGHIPERDLRRISEVAAPIIGKSKCNISKYNNRVSVEVMLNELAYQHAVYGCKVALLDNLNFFLEVTSAQNQYIEMDYAIHEFVMMTKSIPMHIILIVHPNKGGSSSKTKDQDRVNSEFDIKGSSTAVQEASNVLLYNRPLQEEIDSGKRRWSDRELVFKKIRKRGYNVNKKFYFNFSNARLEEETD